MAVLAHPPPLDASHDWPCPHRKRYEQTDRRHFSHHWQVADDAINAEGDADRCADPQDDQEVRRFVLHWSPPC